MLKLRRFKFHLNLFRLKQSGILPITQIASFFRRANQVSVKDALLHPALVAIKALRCPQTAIDWFLFLKHFEQTQGLPAAQFETLSKPFTNYAIYRLSSAKRAQFLRAHYSQMSLSLPRPVLASIWTGLSVDLGCLNGKRGGKYRLTLDPSRYCRKEGEMSITLSDAEDGLELAKLTFLSITSPESDQRELLIGGLQGPSTHSGADAKRRIVAATRDLSGLRPKMAVFAAALAFAAATNMQSLRAVSNRTHTINADAGYQRRKMRADYDAFWLERGGAYDELGFKLPIQSERRAKGAIINDHRDRINMFVTQLFEFKEGSPQVQEPSDFAPARLCPA